jgi:hypothetical protein
MTSLQVITCYDSFLFFLLSFILYSFFLLQKHGHSFLNARLFHE